MSNICKCDFSEVIKTLLFIGSKPLIAILPGNKKADLEKLKIIANEKTLRMATQKEVIDLLGYQMERFLHFE